MKKRGFSLVEIVIAMGVISFALVAILGMFPVAMKASKESQEQTRTAAIAQLVFSQMRSQPSTNGSFPFAPDPTAGGANVSILLKPPTERTNWAVFDYDGAPLSQATSGIYASGTPTQTALRPKTAYLARITVTPEVPVPGSSRIKLEVTYPGLVPEANRSTNTYVTYVRNTGL